MKRLALALFASTMLLSGPSLAADPSDARQAIALTPKEFSWLLTEMRGHLDAIGAAQQAVSTGDMEAARQALLERGTARLKAPGRLSFPQKVNDGWRAMAGGMHRSFDAVAEGIANKESAAQIMGRTATLMQHCTGCHASFRLVETP
jgi:cytochrome c556